MSRDHGELGRKLLDDFIRARGESAKERSECVLRQRGWDAHIAAIPDAECIAAIKLAFEFVAGTRHALAGSDRGGDKLARQHKDMDAFLRERTRDLFGDSIAGLSDADLIGKLPEETYWVESLGREVTRTELATELAALKEIRDVTWRAWRLRQDHADELAQDLAVLDELIRRASK